MILVSYSRQTSNSPAYPLHIYHGCSNEHPDRQRWGHLRECSQSHDYSLLRTTLQNPVSLLNFEALTYACILLQYAVKYDFPLQWTL